MCYFLSEDLRIAVLEKSHRQSSAEHSCRPELYYNPSHRRGMYHFPSNSSYNSNTDCKLLSSGTVLS